MYSAFCFRATENLGKREKKHCRSFYRSASSEGKRICLYRSVRLRRMPAEMRGAGCGGEAEYGKVDYGKIATMMSPATIIIVPRSLGMEWDSFRIRIPARTPMGRLSCRNA